MIHKLKILNINQTLLEDNQRPQCDLLQWVQLGFGVRGPGDEDHFFGSKIQANLIAYLNLKYKMNRGIINVLYTYMMCVYTYIYTHVHACSVAQSCLTLCCFMDCSLQAPLSMEFYRTEYWSGQPFPSPRALPNPGIKPRTPLLYYGWILYCLNHQGNKPITHVKYA